MELHVNQILDSIELKQAFEILLFLLTLSRPLSCLQEAFHERVKNYKVWKDAETTLTKKRENKAKLELAHKNDKIPQAAQEITEVHI